jgi:hypothetical protein
MEATRRRARTAGGPQIGGSSRGRRYRQRKATATANGYQRAGADITTAGCLSALGNSSIRTAQTPHACPAALLA